MSPGVPGPRASQALMLCARARALYDGRLAPSIDDVHALAEPVLQHRMALTFAARAEGMTVRDVDRAAGQESGDLMAADRRGGRPRSPARATRLPARGMRASLVPDLLVEARRIVNTVIAGWHGRRKRGIGENFWQFRPYVDGESDGPHRLAPLGPRRPHLCARPRMGGRPHRLAVGRSVAVDALQIHAVPPSPRRSRALVLDPGACRASVAQRRAHRLAGPHRSVLGAQRRRAAGRAPDATRRSLSARPDLSAIRRFSRHRASPAIFSTRSRRPWPGSTCCRATACAPI